MDIWHDIFSSRKWLRHPCVGINGTKLWENIRSDINLHCIPLTTRISRLSCDCAHSKERVTYGWRSLSIARFLELSFNGTRSRHSQGIVYHSGAEAAYLAERVFLHFAYLRTIDEADFVNESALIGLAVDIRATVSPCNVNVLVAETIRHPLESSLLSVLVRGPKALCALNSHWGRRFAYVNVRKLGCDVKQSRFL